jgi:hypothetical protein
MDRWIADGMCSVREAERIAAMIAFENSQRIYPLN